MGSGQDEQRVGEGCDGGEVECCGQNGVFKDGGEACLRKEASWVREAREEGLCEVQTPDEEGGTGGVEEGEEGWC